MTAPATGIVMLHSVGAPDPAWTWSHLTVPWRLFDRQLAVLRRFGYRSVFLDEYLDMARAGLIERERVVALTFDDGYLDNWVYAAPLLERHGFVGTVFMTTDFIDPSPNPRPRFNPDRPGETTLPRPGFLSWPEMRALEHSGVMRVESHARTHTWYPADPEIVDFRYPGDDYPWMDWNDAPDRKWAYLRAEERPEVWGEPVYRHAKALEGPRYLPDPGLGMVLRAAVGRAGPEFFSRPGWRDDLFALVRAHGELLQGQYETRLEFLARAWAELDDSRRILSEGLGREVRFLCWPGGGYDDELFAAAAELYAGTSVASRHWSARAGFDAQGCFRFRRIAPPGVETRSGYRYLEPSMLFLALEETRGGGKLARLARGARTVVARRLAW
ncbi:MAG: hypothetical protein EOM10_00110 [Opitutae bacterium]|nr:hypothetical protein [Opitutae bacterium]